MALRDIYETGFDEASGKTISADACPECRGSLHTDAGEISCVDCGLIVDDERFDHSPDCTGGTDADRERTGAPLTPARHDRGLSTEIGYGGDATGKHLSSRKRRQIARLRHQQQRARWQTKAEKNLAHACGELARLASGLDLPKPVREEAAVIYRRAQQADLIRGRAIETMTAGSLYAACRCRGHPRTPREIAEVAQCDEPKIRLGYRVLNVELGLEAQLVAASDYVPRLAADCGATNQIQHRALELASLAAERGLANGRHPAGIAAACLYLAGREYGRRLTQVELAEYADVSTMTLRARSYELEAELRD